MVETKKNAAVEDACAFFEQRFGPTAELQGDFGCADMEHAGPQSDAFEVAHVLDILQSVRRLLIKDGKTVYHLCH